MKFMLVVAARPLFKLRDADSVKLLAEAYFEGASSDDDLINGTYLHGVLDSAEFLQTLLRWAGATEAAVFDYEAHKLVGAIRLLGR